MQQLHFITLPSSPEVAAYSLELSAILRDVGIGVDHIVPETGTERDRAAMETYRTLDHEVQGSKELSKGIFPLALLDLQEFSRELSEGIIVLSAAMSPTLPEILACLRTRLGRKIVLILHGISDCEEDNALRLCFRLSHLTILPSYLDLSNAMSRDMLNGDVFAIPLRDDYPAVFVNAIQTSQRIQSPLVSVVMTCYNQPEYIDEAIKSLKAQTFTDWECIVVDDASKDNSAEVVKSHLDDGRFRLIMMERNSGSAGARNAGLDKVNALSEYVMIFDGDDVIEPDHLETLILRIGTDITVAGAYGQLTFIDKKGETVHNPRNSPVRVPPGNRLTGNMMAGSCLIYPPTGALFRKWAAIAAGPFNTWLKQSDDWDWMTRVVILGDMLFTPKKVVRYRLHGESLQHGEDFAGKARAIMERRSAYFYQAAQRRNITDRPEDTSRFSVAELQTTLPPPDCKDMVGVVVVLPEGSDAKPVLAALKKQKQKLWECMIVSPAAPVKGDGVFPFLRDKRFRHTQHTCKNLAAAKNHGASLLSPAVTYLMFLGPKDVLVPEALTIMVSLLTKHTEPPAASARRIEDAKDFPGVMDWHTPEVFDVSNPVTAPASMMIRASAWKYAGPFSESLKVVSEWALWARLSRLAPLAHLRFPLIDAKGPDKRSLARLEKQAEDMKLPMLLAVEEGYRTGRHEGYYYDPLLRNRVRLPCLHTNSDDVICVAASREHKERLTALLSSLKRHANLPDAQRIVFNIGEDAEIEEIATQWGARTVAVEPLSDSNEWGKTILYGAASLLGAGRILCLDVDMVVLNDLSVLMHSIDDLDPDSLLLVGEAGTGPDIMNSWAYLYEGTDNDVVRLGLDGLLGKTKFTPNDGLILGSCRALLRLEYELRNVFRGHWDITNEGKSRREAFLSVALARLGSTVPISHKYNMQMHLHKSDVYTTDDNVRNARIFHQNNPVHIVHYSGPEKDAHKRIQTFYRELTPETAIERLEDDDEQV